MARKPNYRFERLQKDRAKAAKKAERLEAKRSKTPKEDQPGDAAGDGEVIAEGGEEGTDPEPNLRRSSGD